jgi:hypothetical protein
MDQVAKHLANLVDKAKGVCTPLRIKILPLNATVCTSLSEFAKAPPLAKMALFCGKTGIFG